MKKDIYFILAILLFTFIFFYQVILHPNQVVQGRDSIEILHPVYELYHEGLKNKEFQLWDPTILSGKIPDMEVSLFYPLNFLLIIFSNAKFLDYFFVFHMFLAGLFTYLFLRLLKIKRSASLIAAIIYMLNGNLIDKIPGHIPHFGTMALMPLMFLLLELLITKRKLIYSILFSLALSLQFLIGHPQFFFISSIALLIYFIFRFAQEKSFKILKYSLISFIFFILLSSALLLPLIEFSNFASNRTGSSYEFSTRSSFNPFHLVNFLMPYFFGIKLYNTYWGFPGELYNYLGIFPLILALIGLFKKNKYKPIFLTISIFALIFALGKYTPIFKLLFLIPPINFFQAPERMMILFAFSIAVLAGFGFDTLIKNPEKKHISIINKLVLIFSVLSLAVMLSVLIFKDIIFSIGKNILQVLYTKWSYTTLVKSHSFDYFISKIPEVYSTILISLIILTTLLILSSILLYLIRNNKFNIKALSIITILFIFLDLFLLNSFTLNPTLIMSSEFNATNLQQLYAKTSEIEFLLQDNSLFRFYERSGILPQHLSTKYGLQSAGGYSSVTIKHYDELIKNAINLSLNENYISKILGLSNVKYILSKKELENSNFEKIWANTSIIYFNKDYLPRAYIVPESIILKETEILDKIKTDFNPKQAVILEEGSPVKTKSKFQEANITSYSPNKITLEIQLDEPGFLVLSETYYPGWKAYDNNKETEIYKANYAFRSIYLDKGTHIVEFIYRPYFLKIGIYITLITLVILSILTFCLVNKNRKV